jgi:hypothetical protein
MKSITIIHLEPLKHISKIEQLEKKNEYLINFVNSYIDKINKLILNNSYNNDDFLSYLNTINVYLNKTCDDNKHNLLIINQFTKKINQFCKKSIEDSLEKCRKYYSNINSTKSYHISYQEVPYQNVSQGCNMSRNYCSPNIGLG